MKLISLSPFLSFVLIPFITVSPVWAQIPASPGSSAAADPTVAQNLQLRLVEREAAEVPPGSKALKGFTVEVTDSAGTPVQDAAVAARFPDNGPSGVFADGTRALVVYTNASGRARISGIRWGETPGVVTLRVTATKGISHAGMLIEQTLGAAAIPRASSETRPPTTVTVVPVTAPVQPATAIPGTKPKLVPAQLPPAQPATPQTKPIPAVVVMTTAGQAATAQNAQNTTPQNSPSRRTNS
ncbi:MAG: hypothetical protein JO211_00405, partial [Acidobacteriaceae bacterium]|nr:hypothetical protein [Acidobacteriaceae bacterium]